MTVASDKLRARGPVGQPARSEARDDPTAFEEFFHQHFSRVYGAVFRLVGDPAEAEELAVEAFWRLHQRPPSREDNLSGWLYRVATNLGLNALRARKRRQRYELEAGRWETAASPDVDPQEALAESEERRRVRHVLEQMNPRQAQLLVLRYSGLPYREIASALGVSPGSVGTLLARAEREFERRYTEGG